jgi:hypothetical protein
LAKPIGPDEIVIAALSLFLKNTYGFFVDEKGTLLCDNCQRHVMCIGELNATSCAAMVRRLEVACGA